MSDTDIVIDLQRRVEAARVQRAKSLAELERCEADLDRARQALKEQFEVDTPEQAAILLKELTALFDEEKKLIEEGLRDLES